MPKTSAETEAAGSMARLSVSSMPVSFCASSSFHMKFFSVWSGCVGWPGAGRMPTYLVLSRSSHESFSSGA